MCPLPEVKMPIYSSNRDLLPEISREKYYQPEKWSSFHRYLVMLEIAGKRPGQIAEIADISIGRVSTILNDPRAELDRINLGTSLADRLTDIQSKLDLYAHEALEVIVEELRDPSNKADLRVKAGFGLMDRAGYTPSSKEGLAPPPDIPEELVARVEEVSKELGESEFTYRIIEPKLIEGAEEVMSE